MEIHNYDNSSRRTSPKPGRMFPFFPFTYNLYVLNFFPSQESIFGFYFKFPMYNSVSFVLFNFSLLRDVWVVYFTEKKRYLTCHLYVVVNKLTECNFDRYVQLSKLVLICYYLLFIKTQHFILLLFTINYIKNIYKKRLKFCLYYR